MNKYKVRFDSKMVDYSPNYEFTMKFSQDGKPTVTVTSSLVLTDYFDEKGYLHRYKVKEFVYDTIKEEKLQSYISKKKQ